MSNGERLRVVIGQGRSWRYAKLKEGVTLEQVEEAARERGQQVIVCLEARPEIGTLMEWESEGGCEAVDGCYVEPDGVCEHGAPSWLLALGMI